MRALAERKLFAPPFKRCIKLTAQEITVKRWLPKVPQNLHDNVVTVKEVVFRSGSGFVII